MLYRSPPAVVGGLEDRTPLGDIGRAPRHRKARVFERQPGVAPRLPHEGLVDVEEMESFRQQTMAFVSYGIVLVRVRTMRCVCLLS